MRRFKLTVEYDGTGLVGWQRQENGMSVQQAIEEACFKFAHHDARLFVAGRTDAGVHGLAMVAHVDLDVTMKAEKIIAAINHLTSPMRISVIDCEEVASDFHARFDCLERAYLYRILNRRPRPALLEGYVWWISTPLDLETMQSASALLIGKHDFSTFRAAACQANSPLRTLDEITLDRVGDEIHLRCRAKSFLHHQVRNIVGSLVEVGRGRWSVNDFHSAFKACDRTKGGPTAPPQGLYFVKATY